MVNLDRILKTCFWEYNFTTDNILKISQGENMREKKFLFEKILLNSTEMLQDLQIFTQKDLEFLIEDFKVTVFNHDYVFKRKNIAEVYFLNKDLEVDELKWIA
jgi:hypothetical protein